MERTLSLVLDSENKVSLTLMKEDAYLIDKFTSKFYDSDEIRAYFKIMIDEFLENNKTMIEQIQKKTGKKYRGHIVLIQAINNRRELTLERTKVLYKGYNAVSEYGIKNKSVMQKAFKLDKIRISKNMPELMPPFFVRIIYGRPFDSIDIDNFKNWLKKKDNLFFERRRIIVEAYEKVKQEGVNLPTIESIIKNDLLEKEEKNKKRKETLENKKMALVKENKFSFPLETEDEILNSLRDREEILMYYDLDDLKKYKETENLFDGLGDLNGKQRTKSIY